MWFEQIPRGLDWTGATTIRNQAVLERSADEVFAIWAELEQWPRWFDDILSGEWLGEPRACVGARREIRLKGLSVREEFLAWEPGRRFAFTMTAISVPLTTSIVEDYRLEPLDDGRCTFTWIVNYDLRRPFRLVSPVVAWRFRGMFRRATASLADYVRREGGR